MRVGQIYGCPNPVCQCEIEVTKTSTEVQSNPRRCCGADMKKPYAKPTLRVLDAQPELLADERTRK